MEYNSDLLKGIWEVLNKVIQSFDPIIDQYSRVIVLGSMPGEESLKKQQYYGHTRNHFWKILYTVFGAGEVHETYKDKVQFLLNHQLALWDVLAYCDREGSLDSNIKNEVPNNFHSLFSQYPSIEYVVFNGTKAHNSFQKYISFSQFPEKTFHLLPSTSPANTIGIHKKLQEWMIIKEFSLENKIASREW